MTDRYASISDLTKRHAPERDFRVRVRVCPGTTAIVAPHGGGIEPGTSEVAEAVAGDDFSFYAFEGMMRRGNRVLHIASTRFDEPQCVRLVEASPRAISIHGERSRRRVVFFGGLDKVTVARLRRSLADCCFRVEEPQSTGLQGLCGANICNRCQGGVGVQLELSLGLRQSFFRSLSSRDGRRIRTERFERFVAAVRHAIR